MLEILELDETLDWAQKRFKITKVSEWSHNAEFKSYLKFFYKKRNMRLSWHLYMPHKSFFDLLDYIKMYRRQGKVLKKLYKFFMLYNGLYRKTFYYMRSLRIFFYGQLMKRHCVLKFIFGPQQIFFQIFTRNAFAPDTHTTVGMLIRIRENIRDHGGKYVFRNVETIEGAAIERHKDKKHMVYFRRPSGLENIRYVIVKKNLIKPILRERKEEKIRRAKRELFIKSLKKKNKDVENVVILNKRGNPKTESYIGKAQRRRFNTWLWFIKCVALYIRKKNIKILKNTILSITGLIKIHKQILKYILSTFEKYKLTAFILKLNLKYRGAKLKHFTTIKKKTRKRLIKIEHSTFFK